MNIKNKLIYVKNIMLPCLFLSLLVGVLTGISVFIFKIIASKIIYSSKYLYTFLNENKIYPCSFSKYKNVYVKEYLNHVWFYF